MRLTYENNKEHVIGIALIFISWLFSRAILWAWYQPLEYMDTGTYKQLASQFASLDFSNYNGQRTPIYPLMIALLGQNNYFIWAVQSLMGLGVGIIAYIILIRENINWRWCTFSGLMSVLALNAMFFEPVIMTETISAFLLIAVLYYFFSTIRGGGNTRQVVTLSFFVGLVVLTRPQFIVLIPILTLLLYIYLPSSRIRLSGTYLVLALMPLFAWGMFNSKHVGSFTVTTLTGYNLSNHSGAFMEKAPDEYAELRDIYLKYREQKINETGSHTMTIFVARHEMMRETGMSEIELSKEFQKISMSLFVANPGEYFKNVAKAWISFWPVPNYWRLELFENSDLSSGLDKIWKAQHIFIRVMNAFFLIAVVFVMWKFIKGNKSIRDELLLPVTLMAVVLGISILQALVEYGENPRYYIPNQTVIIIVFAYYFPKLIKFSSKYWQKKSPKVTA